MRNIGNEESQGSCIYNYFDQDEKNVIPRYLYKLKTFQILINRKVP